MRAVIYGILASIALLAFYASVNYLASGYEGLYYNFRNYWTYVLAIDAGFGVQIALYSYIRSFHKSCKSVATSGISAGSMVACCLHHVTDVIPVFGVGMSFLLSTYTEFFMLVGVLSSLVGVVWMLSTIQKHKLYEGTALAKLMVVDFEKLRVIVLILAVIISIWKYTTTPYYMF